jgi:hypothetical protein
MSTPTFNRNVTPIRSRYSRGNDNKSVPEVDSSTVVGLLDIDGAILAHLQEKIKPVVDQDKKLITVPIIYGNPERWKSAQLDGGFRDDNGKILLPVIMIRRTSMTKSSINSPVNKYQQYVFKSGWNARNIYDRFTIVNRITPSQIYHTSVVPDHYNLEYEAVVWTEYTEQMNGIVENISFESNEYWGKTNNYKFITRIDKFDYVTDLPVEADRTVKSKFIIHVRAYILPEYALNSDGNKVKTFKLEYSPKKVVFDTEIVVNSV